MNVIHPAPICISSSEYEEMTAEQRQLNWDVLHGRSIYYQVFYHESNGWQDSIEDTLFEVAIDKNETWDAFEYVKYLCEDELPNNSDIYYWELILK